MNLLNLLPAIVAQTGEVVDDPGSQRVVNAVVMGLVLVGLIVIAVTVWFWRSTRPDHQALGRLELMSGRRFRGLPDDEARRGHLEGRHHPESPQQHPEPEVDDSVPLPRPEVQVDRPIDPLLRPPPPVP